MKLFALLWMFVGLGETHGLQRDGGGGGLRNLRLSAVHDEAAHAIFPLTVPGGCTSHSILQRMGDACDCLPAPFLRALLGLPEEDDNDAALHESLGALCGTAWQSVETSDWHDIDPVFTDEFMERFVQGETYLNGTFVFCRETPRD